MKKYSVQILKHAWEDLQQIEDWYRIVFDNKTALKVVNNILDSISTLETFPEMGSKTPDDWINMLGYRMLVVKRHIVIYKFLDDVVYIYHIADYRQEYSRLF